MNSKNIKRMQKFWKMTTPPVTERQGIVEFFNPGWDEKYFNQFECNPHELSFLAIHDFRSLHMKNIYYYQMELLHKYPEGQKLNGENIKEFRTLLADYSMSILIPLATFVETNAS